MAVVHGAGSAELVTALLGVWLAGAAYLPVDPGYPAARVGVHAGRRGAGGGGGRRTGGGAGGGRAGRGAGGGSPDDPAAAAAAAAGPAVPVPAAVRAEQLAYVIYTSGSTGVPKGVAVTHGGLANLRGARWPAAWAGPGGRGCCCSWRRLAFDAVGVRVSLALLAGARLVVGAGGRDGGGGSWRVLAARRG